MADEPKQPGRLSTRNKQPMKSRGMLSHGSATASEGDAGKPKRSRGMLSHDGVNDTSPKALDPPKPRRPYKLEDE